MKTLTEEELHERKDNELYFKNGKPKKNICYVEIPNT